MAGNGGEMMAGDGGRRRAGDEGRWLEESRIGEDRWASVSLKRMNRGINQ